MLVRRVLILPSVVLCLNACYTYIPTAANWDVLPVNTAVRVRLTRAEQFRIEGDVPGGDRLVEGGLVVGKLVDVYDDAFLLTASFVDEAGFRYQELGQRLLIRKSGFLEIETRRLDYWKTGSLVGLGGLALVALALNQFTAAFGGKPSRPPPGP